MTLTDQITELLAEHKVDYKIFEHEPVVTSQDAARVRATDISMGAKALIFVADKEPILVVVPGDKRLNSKRFKETYKIKDLSMADAEKLKEITGQEKGAVPPIGKIFGLKTYFDASFTSKDRVAFNAGSHTVSIEMAAQDLIQVADPIIGELVDD